MKKKIIGIITSIKDNSPFTENIYATKTYVDAIKKAGGTPILIPVIEGDDFYEQYDEICDAFLFTGGVDITPQFYNEEPFSKIGETNLQLDKFQIEMMRTALESQKPILGICRGAQLLNVVAGGTLHQDLSQAGKEILKHVQQTNFPGNAFHNASIEEESILYDIFGSSVQINSFHHQSVKEAGKDLKIIARANDGIVEAVQHVDRKFCVGVQWHPEMMLTQNDIMLPLFERFISAI